MSPSIASNGPKRRGQLSRRQPDKTASSELSDLELIILSRAAQHPDCLARVADHSDRGDAERAIGCLTDHGFLVRMPENSGPSERGIIGEQDHANWRITSAGLSAIGVDPSELPRHWQHAEDGYGGGSISNPSDEPFHLDPAAETQSERHSHKTRSRTDAASPSSALAPCEAAELEAMPALDARKDTKNRRLVGLLSRDSGATTAEIMEATGWLAHSSRAALTGLRKKGHAIQREQDVGNRGTVYRIVAKPEPKTAAEV
jgi:hypothetical protein